MQKMDPPKTPRRRQRYRSEKGKVAIEVKLRNARQLFDARDPAPFRDRDLDDDAADYIFSCLREFALKTPVKLIVHFSEEQQEESFIRTDELIEAIRGHFSYEVEATQRKTNHTFRQGQVSLLFGFGFLAVCLFLASLVKQLPDSILRATLYEGLTISGYVALWKPLNIFLYEWWPLLETRRYLLKLSKLDIDIRWPPKKAEGPTPHSG